MKRVLKMDLRRPSFFGLLLFVLLIVSLPSMASAQESQDRGESNLNTAPPNGITPEEIIKKFAAREKEFSQAREEYTFRQFVKVQTLDGDTPDGEYQQIVDVTFDDKNRRRESVVFSPQSTLVRVSMTREDFDDIQHRYPFVLTTDELPLYQIIYTGQQKIDEVDTYVFDVAPKTIEVRLAQGGTRHFEGERVFLDGRVDHEEERLQGVLQLVVGQLGQLLGLGFVGFRGLRGLCVDGQLIDQPTARVHHGISRTTGPAAGRRTPGAIEWLGHQAISRLFGRLWFILRLGRRTGKWLSH